METKISMLEKLMAKAVEDTDFRQQLLSNPESALKEAFDISVPDDFKIVVHEDDVRTSHLVLPASTELTDAQLKNAAGGGSCDMFGYNLDWGSY